MVFTMGVRKNTPYLCVHIYSKQMTPTRIEIQKDSLNIARYLKKK